MHVDKKLYQSATSPPELSSIPAAHLRLCRHRTSSTVTVCSPPLLSLSPTAVQVIRRRPTIVVRRHRLSCSCIVSTGLKISSNICLGPLAPPFHFLTQNASIQFQGNPFSSDQSHANVLVVSRVAAVQGLFSPLYFRSLERKFTLGSFAPKNESSGELSLPGVKVPGNFCSREWMFPGTFVPQSDILGSELYV